MVANRRVFEIRLSRSKLTYLLLIRGAYLDKQGFFRSAISFKSSIVFGVLLLPFDVFVDYYLFFGVSLLLFVPSHLSLSLLLLDGSAAQVRLSIPQHTECHSTEGPRMREGTSRQCAWPRLPGTSSQLRHNAAAA